MAVLTDASSWDCHSENDQNDVKLCFVEDDDLLAKVTCNSMEHWISSRLWRVVLLWCIRIQSKGFKLRVKWWGNSCGNYFCGLRMAQRSQTQRGHRLREPYRINVNNRVLNHVWISWHSLLCKRYGSSFLLITDWFLYYCLISLQRLIGNGLYL